jgi:predicted RNA methylase
VKCKRKDPNKLDNEFFPTPSKLASLLVKRLLWQYPNRPQECTILEPSAGTGAFVRPLAELGVVTAIDPNFDAPEDLPEDLPEGVEWGRMSLEDLHEALEGERPFDLVCGNPPFSLAEKHLRLLFSMVKLEGSAVGFLLRLGFLSSKKRRTFFGAWPPTHIYVLSSRPSFMWSYTCKACKTQWFVLPDNQEKECRECGSSDIQLVKTDQYDYCFCVWRFPQVPGKEPTLSWINPQEDE